MQLSESEAPGFSINAQKGSSIWLQVESASACLGACAAAFVLFNQSCPDSRALQTSSLGKVAQNVKKQKYVLLGTIAGAYVPRRSSSSQNTYVRQTDMPHDLSHNALLLSACNLAYTALAKPEIESICFTMIDVNIDRIHSALHWYEFKITQSTNNTRMTILLQVCCYSTSGHVV